MPYIINISDNELTSICPLHFFGSSCIFIQKIVEPSCDLPLQFDTNQS